MNIYKDTINDLNLLDDTKKTLLDLFDGDEYMTYQYILENLNINMRLEFDKLFIPKYKKYYFVPKYEIDEIKSCEFILPLNCKNEQLDLNTFKKMPSILFLNENNVYISRIYNGKTYFIKLDNDGIKCSSLDYDNMFPLTDEEKFIINVENLIKIT